MRMALFLHIQVDNLRLLAVCAVSLLIHARSAGASPPREAVTFGSEGNLLTYAILGDSTAAGVGGSYEHGIAMATARALAHGRRVVMTNLGVSGARTNDVLKVQTASAEAIRPDLVLISVGANDVTHLTPIRSIRRDLRAIVRRLRVANPSVAIVITGSPDMGSPPRIPRLLRGVAACQTARINRMMRAVALTDRLVFAPIAEVTGPLFRRDPSLFASDRFHPNDRGYQTWIPVLDGALAKALSQRTPKQD